MVVEGVYCSTIRAQLQDNPGAETFPAIKISDSAGNIEMTFYPGCTYDRYCYEVMIPELMVLFVVPTYIYIMEQLIEIGEIGEEDHH